MRLLELAQARLDRAVTRPQRESSAQLLPSALGLRRGDEVVCGAHSQSHVLGAGQETEQEICCLFGPALVFGDQSCRSQSHGDELCITRESQSSLVRGLGLRQGRWGVRAKRAQGVGESGLVGGAHRRQRDTALGEVEGVEQRE